MKQCATLNVASDFWLAVVGMETVDQQMTIGQTYYQWAKEEFAGCNNIKQHRSVR